MASLITDVDPADDYLAFLTSLQMLMTLLGGLLIKTDNPADPTYDGPFLEAALVAINCMGFIALALSLALLSPKCRERSGAPGRDDIAAGAGGGTRTKVSPVAGGADAGDQHPEATRSWS